MKNGHVFICVVSGLLAALLVSAAVLLLLPLGVDQRLLVGGILFPVLSAIFLISPFRRFEWRRIFMVHGFLSCLALGIIFLSERL